MDTIHDSLVKDEGGAASKSFVVDIYNNYYLDQCVAVYICNYLKSAAIGNGLIY